MGSGFSCGQWTKTVVVCSRLRPIYDSWNSEACCCWFLCEQHDVFMPVHSSLMNSLISKRRVKAILQHMEFQGELQCWSQERHAAPQSFPSFRKWTWAEFKTGQLESWLLDILFKLAEFYCKNLDNSTFSCVGRLFSTSATQSYCWNEEVPMEFMKAHQHGCAPIKLYLQSQIVFWICSEGLSSPNLICDCMLCTANNHHKHSCCLPGSWDI